MRLLAAILLGSAGAWHVAPLQHKLALPGLPLARAPLVQPQCPSPRAATVRMAKEMATAEDDEEEDTVTATALKSTGLAVLAALAFCAGVFLVRGPDDATSWLAAYVLEESLSIDNLFVFTLIFDFFQTPLNAQPRVLRWGLIGAVVLRGVFIFGGLAVIERFRGVLLLFSAVLLYSAYGLFFEEDEEDEDLSQNAVVQFTQKYLPSTDKYDGDKFFTSVDGAILATPLLLALVCVEVSDVLFAVDSVPAVFGVTTDPVIALTSNAFALLGLRSLYVLVAKGIDQFECAQPEP